MSSDDAAPKSQQDGLEKSAAAKLDDLWQQVLASGPGDKTYPDVKTLSAYGRELQYSALLDYTADVQPAGREKVICSAGGAVAQVRFEWREQARHHFTGMFRKADCGLIRCSSVIEPSAVSSWSPLPAMIPMVGLKFFRDGKAPSGDIVLAHKKSGGKEANFMSYAISNHFTENIKYPFKAALALFQKYSKFPTFTGLSEFASMTQQGDSELEVKAPYALVLVPPAHLQSREVAMAGDLSKQLRSLPVGELLYEAYAVPEPLTAKLPGTTTPCKSSQVVDCPHKPAIWRVGDLRLASEFVSSSFGDSKLFFRHNLVDKDLEVRPDWVDYIDTMLGAPFYHSVIQTGDIWDPEAPPQSDPVTRESMLERVEAFKKQEEVEEENFVRSVSLQDNPPDSAVTEVAADGMPKPCCPFAACWNGGTK